jgi:hypothetical protein
MSLDLFRLTRGIDIQTDDLTSNAYILQGVGVPGNRQVENDAPQGSIYMRTDDTTDGSTPIDAALNKLQLYWKHTAGSGADKWAIAASKEFVESVVQGVSWREPVRYLDTAANGNFTTIAAAVADMNADDQLGAQGPIVAGDRILFAEMGIGDGGPNVYIVGGTSGNWTLTEDTNEESDGDAVLINEGAHADQQWIFDGLSWIQFGSAGSAQELQYIRDYIGKGSPGVKLPDYLSEDLITDGDALDTSISKLDDAIGTLQFTENNLISDFTRITGSPDYNSTTDITAALDLVDQAMGDGEITNDGGNYALSDDMSWGAAGTLDLTDALNELNNVIGDRTYTNDYIVADGQNIAVSIDALDSIIGDIDNSSAWTAGGYLGPTTAAGNNVQETLDSFNQVIGDLVSDTEEGTGSVAAATPTVIDSIPTTEATEVKWILQVKRTSNNGRRAIEVHALTDGTTADHNTFSVLNLGSAVGNIGLTVAVNAGNLEFSLNPANALTYTIKRVSKTYLA